jgi:hypothetical protein
MGSWWVTVALSLIFAALYVYLGFGENTYQRWIRIVFHSPPGLIVYVCLVANIALASLRVAIDRLKEKEITPEAVKEMDVYASLPPEAPLDEISGWMRRKGFHPDAGGGGLIARKGKFCFVPGTVMRAGLVVFMAAFALGLHIRETDEALLHEGESAALLGREARLGRITSSLPEEFLQVGEKSIFELKDVSATLSSSGRTHEITPGYPGRFEGLYWRITHIGYRQPLVVDETAFAPDLDVLPPGRTHRVETKGDGPSLSFTLEPEETISKGLLTGRLYNLRSPRYRLALKDGGEKHEAVLGPSGSSELGGVPVSLGEKSLYVRINAVYDPALFWVYAGIVLTLLGALLVLTRFFWYERLMRAAAAEDALLIGYSEEFYRKWGVMKFQRWREELRSVLEPPVEEAEPPDADQRSPEERP